MNDRWEPIAQAEHDLHTLELVLDDLHEDFEKTPDTVIAGFEALDRAQDKITLLIEKIQSAKARRIAKAYGDAFQHLFQPFQQAAE